MVTSRNPVAAPTTIPMGPSTFVSSTSRIPAHAACALVPPAASTATLPQPVIRDGAGQTVDAAAIGDASLASGIDLPRGSAEAPASVVADYGKPVTVRSATLFVRGGAAMFFGATIEPQLESSVDGKSWTTVGTIPAMQVPTTISFAPVTARLFRVTLRPVGGAGANMGNPAPGIEPPMFFAAMAGAGAKTHRIAQFRLSPDTLVDRFEAKAGFEIERNYYSLGLTDAAAPGVPLGQVINLTDRVKPDGTLDWTPPKGNWKVIRLGYSLLGTTNHPAPPEATGLEVDKFDGEAVARYLEAERRAVVAEIEALGEMAPFKRGD
mgnify:CR=1 FL=1